MTPNGTHVSSTNGSYGLTLLPVSLCLEVAHLHSCWLSQDVPLSNFRESVALLTNTSFPVGRTVLACSTRDVKDSISTVLATHTPWAGHVGELIGF
jgi:hypothetical protein